MRRQSPAAAVVDHVRRSLIRRPRYAQWRAKLWDADPRQRRLSRGLFREPRHLRDALRGGARFSARHARGALPVRGRRYRRGRRLRAHGRQARRHAAASGTRARQRPREPAQRPRRARPVVNIVGDHATYHVQYDAQLQSDIETVARSVAGLRTRSKARPRCAATRPTPSQAAYGPPGQVATLILPADDVLGRGRRPEHAAGASPPATAADDVVRWRSPPASGRAHRHAARRRHRCARAAFDARPDRAATTGANCVPRPSRPHGARRGPLPSSASPISPSWRRCKFEGLRTAGARRCASRRCRSSPIPARRAISFPTHAQCMNCRRRNRMLRGASRSLRSRSARTTPCPRWRWPLALRLRAAKS